MILFLNISAPAIDTTNTTNGAGNYQNRAPSQRQFLDVGRVLQFLGRVWQAAEVDRLVVLGNLNPVRSHMHPVLLWNQVLGNRQALNRKGAMCCPRHSVRVGFARQAFVGVASCFRRHDYPEAKDGQFRQTSLPGVTDAHLDLTIRLNIITDCGVSSRRRQSFDGVADDNPISFFSATEVVRLRCYWQLIKW